MKKPQEYYTGGEKSPVLRRHLLEHEPFSKLCDEFELLPTVL